MPPLQTCMIMDTVNSMESQLSDSRIALVLLSF